MFGKLFKKIEPAKDPWKADHPEEPSPIESTPPGREPSAALFFPPPPPAKAAPPSPHGKEEEKPEGMEASSAPSVSAAPRVVQAPPPPMEAPKPKQEESRIGIGSYLRGALAFSGRLVVNGRFSGTVSTPEGTVQVAPTADVQADIEATDLLVEGKVRGNLSVRDSLELRNGADVQGSIRCLRLQIAEAAAFRGPCECFRPAAPEEQAEKPRRPDLYGFFTAAQIASIRL